MFRISCFADEISPNINVQVETMRSLRLKYVELRSVWDKNVLDLSDEELKTVKSVFDENGISVSSVGSPLGKVDIDCNFEEYLEKVYRAIEIAKFFGTKYIRIFSFYHEGKSLDECREKVIKRLKIMTGAAKREGIVLCHENEAAIYGERGDRCRDLLTSVNDPSLRAVLDPANYVLAGEKPFECLKYVHDYVEYLHMKDATFGGSIVPAGEGDGHVKDVLDFLRYRDGMFVTLEPHLAHAGSMRGFSGAELFGIAYKAFAALLSELGIEYI